MVFPAPHGLMWLREDVKYYFADFVRKGGEGGPPQIRNSFFAEKFRQGGRGGGEPHLRKKSAK